MAAEAEAAREARAKVIAAEGEMKASRALKEASDVIIESPAALQVRNIVFKFARVSSDFTIFIILQLRYLQTLNTISAEKNSTIIFPLPIDLLKAFIPSLKEWKRQISKIDFLYQSFPLLPTAPGSFTCNVSFRIAF